ncbi:MAG: hypothetical protein P1U57_12980 [Oleibacter sp.]|nr:hypothetical protein [Thalassolituus sp.]
MAASALTQQEAFDNERRDQALALLAQGRVLKENKDYHAAHALFVQAHDLVVRCPALHKIVHQHLLSVHWRVNKKKKFFIDCFLLAFAFAGIFELIAKLARDDSSFAAKFCLRIGSERVK